MPALIRFLIRHALIGAAIGFAFTAVILVLDIGSIRTMTRGSAGGTGIRLLLAFFVSTTFASAQMGVAVMFPPSRKDDPMAPPDDDGNDR
jgi:type III secretory pathway component EscT